MSLDTPVRSLAKAVSWRITGSVDTFLISWLITGEPKLAAGITLVELLTKISLYWLHERVWLKVKWGQNVSKNSHPDNGG